MIAELISPGYISKHHSLSCLTKTKRRERGLLLTLYGQVIGPAIARGRSWNLDLGSDMSIRMGDEDICTCNNSKSVINAM